METERIILRPWTEADAEELFQYASDPRVGSAAGWAAHESIENSREIIRGVLSEPETYAIVLKATGKPVGSIGLMIGKHSNLGIPDTQGEIGYWIGVPYWGLGIMPEAVHEILRYGFTELCLDRIWCAYFDGNDRSRHVQEKCGFKYVETRDNMYWAQINEYKTEHISCIIREEWKRGHSEMGIQL